MRHQVVSGWDLGQALLKAGLLPPNCGKIIIEIPVDGPVTMHMVTFADERLLNVIGASVTEANIQIKEAPTGSDGPAV
jgi:hypothetical protein